MAHFSVEGLTFSYPGFDRLALDGVTFSVKHGSYVCVCGKSGCGKTTLLRQLKTVLAPHGRRSGSVLFNGVPLAEVGERDQSAQIGFVMQNPDAQIVTDKVWHELAFGLESLGCDARTMRLRVAEMASYFGIQGWFHADVRDLSGGQKQLLNLASVMAMQPSVLVMDEPTSQLDPIAAADFLNTVRKINIELGTTVIVTEHRLEDIFSAADRVLVMEDGRLACDGSPREVAAELYARGDDMTYALPAPVRIFYGVEERDRGRVIRRISCGGEGAVFVADTAGDAAAEDGAVLDEMVAEAALADGVLAKNCPLTVREGRNWLTERVLADPPDRVWLPEGELAECDERNAVLSMREVWFRYTRDGSDVLRGVDLCVPAGQTFAVAGGNGTGKSTMLKCACGILRPYRGQVRVLGRKLRDWKAGELFRGGVAMLPQDPQNLFVKKTVLEDLLEMLPAHGTEAGERDAKVAEVASVCDVAGLLDAHPFDLSGGEQQRAALAKVLLADPRLLLLDEPTKGIDSFFKRELARIFDRLKERGVTIVMVSHDVEFCARHADSVSMFFDGSVVTSGTPRRFFSQNSFYTTAANRMSRNVFADAVTDEDVIELCLS